MEISFVCYSLPAQHKSANVTFVANLLRPDMLNEITDMLTETTSYQPHYMLELCSRKIELFLQTDSRNQFSYEQYTLSS